MSEKQNKRIRIIPTLAWGVVVLITINIVISIVAIRASDQANNNAERIKVYQKSACDRGNQIKDILNSHGGNIYDAMVVAASISGPNQRLWRQIKDSIEYSPRTHCDVALRDPTYRSPQPIPWSSKDNPLYTGR